MFGIVIIKVIGLNFEIYAVLVELFIRGVEVISNHAIVFLAIELILKYR